MLTGLEPILWVADIERSVAFYQEQLRFELDFILHGTNDRMVMASVRSGSVGLLIGYRKDASVPPTMLGGGAELYILTDDVNALHDHVRVTPSAIVRPIADQPWGDRTFVVTDPDGYVLQFAQSVTPFDSITVGVVASSA